uniref:Uncharacterized protein n=1 Tax=Oryza nivara TaxID=4536 RepID=A0A0E0GXU1_ORYNI
MASGLGGWAAPATLVRSPYHLGTDQLRWLEDDNGTQKGSFLATDSSPRGRSENGNMEEGAKGSFDISHNFFLLFY